MLSSGKSNKSKDDHAYGNIFKVGASQKNSNAHRHHEQPWQQRCDPIQWFTRCLDLFSARKFQQCQMPWFGWKTKAIHHKYLQVRLDLWNKNTKWILWSIFIHGSSLVCSRPGIQFNSVHLSHRNNKALSHLAVKSYEIAFPSARTVHQDTHGTVETDFMPSGVRIVSDNRSTDRPDKSLFRLRNRLRSYSTDSFWFTKIWQSNLRFYQIFSRSWIQSWCFFSSLQPISNIV